MTKKTAPTQRVRRTSRQHRRLIAMLAALFSAGCARADTAMAETGFLADSTLHLLNRNFYMNRDFRSGGSNSRGINGSRPPGERKGYREEWAHGVRLTFSSGYTPGVLGLGLDAHAHAGFKLDSGRGRTGTDLLPISNNRTADASVPGSYGKAGAAMKVRLSSTVVQWGALRADAPVFSTSDSRLLPATATGIRFRSREIDRLFVEGAHFTGYSFRNSSNSDDDPRTEYAGIGTPSLNYLGGVYRFSDAAKGGLYISTAEDLWNQQYLGVHRRIGLNNDNALKLDLQSYRTRSTGKELAGNIRNLAWSLAGALVFDGHQLRLSYQRVHGNEPFDYVAKDSIYLANASQYADFSAPEEQSVGIRYDFDWGKKGFAGLTSRVSYVRGRNIDGTRADAGGAYAGLYGANGRHSEFNADVRYVIPEGSASGLSIRLRQAIHKANSAQGEGDVHQFRLIIDYPLEIL